MLVTGTIVDSKSGNPLPGSSIVVVKPNGEHIGLGISANNKGEFQLNDSRLDSNSLLITHVSYLPTLLPASLLNASDFPEVGMVLTDETLPPVTVTPGKKEGRFLWWVLGGGGLFLLLLSAGSERRKKVGAINGSDWQNLAVKVGIGVAVYFLIVKPILIKLGILDSKEEKQTDEDRDKALDEGLAQAEKDNPPSFTDGQYSSMADSLFESMRYSWVDDDYNVTQEVLMKAKNLTDVYKLIKFFGKRQECLFGVICSWLTLPEMVKRNLSNSRLRAINESYAANGIEWTW